MKLKKLKRDLQKNIHTYMVKVIDITYFLETIILNKASEDIKKEYYNYFRDVFIPFIDANNEREYIRKEILKYQDLHTVIVSTNKFLDIIDNTPVNIGNIDCYVDIDILLTMISSCCYPFTEERMLFCNTTITKYFRQSTQEERDIISELIEDKYHEILSKVVNKEGKKTNNIDYNYDCEEYKWITHLRERYDKNNLYEYGSDDLYFYKIDDSYFISPAIKILNDEKSKEIRKINLFN